MQKGGDLKAVYARLVNAVNDIEKRIPFSHHDRFGFLTFCPTNLGTTIRASVHIQLPKLAADRTKLEETAGKYNLQVNNNRPPTTTIDLIEHGSDGKLMMAILRWGSTIGPRYPR